MTGGSLRRLLPSRSVPLTRWRSERRWRAKPSTLVVLVVGLWFFGTGEAMLVNAGIGVSPWTVFAEGLSVQLPLAIGTTYFLTSLVILLLWIPLRERLGLGTIANAIVIATALQVMIEVLPTPTGLGWQIALVLAGIASIGIGSGLYLTTNLGPGPRDGLMTGLARRTGWPIRRVRTGIEISVLVSGFLLGGAVGLGTVVFALGVGPLTQFFLRYLVVHVAGPNPPLPRSDS